MDVCTMSNTIGVKLQCRNPSAQVVNPLARRARSPHCACQQSTLPLLPPRCAQQRMSQLNWGQHPLYRKYIDFESPALSPCSPISRTHLMVFPPVDTTSVPTYMQEQDILQHVHTTGEYSHMQHACLLQVHMYRKHITNKENWLCLGKYTWAYTHGCVVENQEMQSVCQTL
jgi:hypothetical protein